MRKLFAFGRTVAELIRSIDPELAKLASMGASAVLAVELLFFWWTHSTAGGRVFGIVLAAVCWASAYFGAWMSKRRCDRRGRRARRVRIGIPPRQVVQEVYSALRNLGYADPDIRRAFNLVPDENLGDFDTLFRCAIERLQPIARQV